MAHEIQTALEKLGDVLIIEADEYLAALLARSHHPFISQAAQLVRNGGFAETKEVFPF